MSALWALGWRLFRVQGHFVGTIDWNHSRSWIGLIAPHRANRKKPKTQGGRPLRRYKRCWNAERLFARLQNFRRILVRHGYDAENYLGFVQLGCTIILLRWYL
jgi:transposase